jgi:hypothetical protein
MIQITIWFAKQIIKSFNEASKRAAGFYGGIHYRAAIENGIVQGKEMGIFS